MSVDICGNAVVNFLDEGGESREYSGIVVVTEGKVYGVARKGQRRFEICDEGQVYSLVSTDKFR